MQIANLFSGTAPREVAGARSANRFAYQVSWAICHLLEIHAEGNDYGVILDLHEDVVVLDCADSPTEVRFYQVKTSSGNWTARSLGARKKGKSGKLSSIIGKLYGNYISCKDHTRLLGFVSNMPLSTSGNGGKRIILTRATLDQLCKADIQTLQNALGDEYPGEKDTDGLKLFVFQRSPLTTDTHSQVALAQVTEFLENNPETLHVPKTAFYKALRNEFDKANQCEAIPEGFRELWELKGITRNKFVDMVAHARDIQPAVDLSTRIESRLQSENVDIRLVVKIKSAVDRLRIRLLDSSNAMLEDDMQRIQQELAEAEDLGPRLSDTMDAVFYSPCGDDLRSRWREEDVRAMIGVCVYEPAAKIPNSDSESQGEEI